MPVHITTHIYFHPKQKQTHNIVPSNMKCKDIFYILAMRTVYVFLHEGMPNNAKGF